MKEKAIKKILLLILIGGMILFPGFVFSEGNDTENIIINGEAIRYGSGEEVKIRKEHDPTGGEFRGVWVSALTGDINCFTGVSSYKKQMMDVLNNMEYYNMNAMIFHVRIKNDALYDSKYNDWSYYYNQDPDEDMLPWLISECHRRGIEFHAWMNPYRVSSAPNDPKTIAAHFRGNNVASDPKNLLKGKNCVILNPGEPAVRDFLVKTCMEVVENYDVDAIHFDDYFYAAGIDDEETRRKYNNGMSVDDFRRTQVDLFIESLHREMLAFNMKTGRRVQLGISPTGVYRNGNGYVSYDENGKAITNGSLTRAYSHYGSPLYADTLKWIENGWIDYILPQTYWAITNSKGSYCDLVRWWDQVCAYQKTNLYSSIGLYMATEGSKDSWGTNEWEGYQQIMFSETMPHVRGCSVYGYKALLTAIKSGSKMKGVKRIWSHKIYLPEIGTMERIVPGIVSDLKAVANDYGNLISFSSLPEAKFYIIYRSEKELTFKENEIIAVMGGDGDLIEYQDYRIGKGKKYHYGVKAQSRSLTLGEGITVEPEDILPGENMSIGEITGLIADNFISGKTGMISFDELFYSFGGEIDYGVECRFKAEDREYEKVSVSGTLVGDKYRCRANIPEGCTEAEIEVLARNRSGEAKKTITVPVNSYLGDLNNFTCKSKGYCGEEAEFIWNAFPGDVVYTVQISNDDFHFNDYDKPEITEQKFNIRVHMPLSDDKGIVFYRIKAEKDGALAFSETVSVCQRKSLGTIENFKAQNSNENSVTINENEELSLEWEQNRSNLKYICYFCIDRENWIGSGGYAEITEKGVSGNIGYQKMNIGYQYWLFDIKIIAEDKSGTAESKTITVRVRPEYLYGDDTVSFLYQTQKNFLKDMNIYK